MIFTEKYLPQMEDYDNNWYLKTDATVRIMENAGGHHAELVGDGLLDGVRKGMSWIIVEWNVKILRRFKHTETLTISTWLCSRYTPYSTHRNYSIADDKGEVCVVATSKLVLINRNTMRIARLNDELLSQYQPEDCSVFEEDFPRMSKPDNFLYEVSFALRRGDIDYNDHLHNIGYIQLALEALPPKVYSIADFSFMRVAYHRPIMANDAVVCQYSVSGDKHTVAYLSSDGTANCLVEFTQRTQ